jgi:hypothetical protein
MRRLWEQLGALSLRHALPAIFTYRPFVAAGGTQSSLDRDLKSHLATNHVAVLLSGLIDLPTLLLKVCGDRARTPDGPVSSQTCCPSSLCNDLRHGGPAR